MPSLLIDGVFIFVPWAPPRSGRGSWCWLRGWVPPAASSAAWTTFLLKGNVSRDLLPLFFSSKHSTWAPHEQTKTVSRTFLFSPPVTYLGLRYPPSYLPGVEVRVSPPVTYLGLRYHHHWPLPGVEVSPPVTYNWGRGITTSDLPGVEVSQPVTYSYLGLRYPHQWPAWGWGIPTSDLYLGLRYLWSTSAGGGWGGWYRAWHNVSSPSNLKLKS